MISGDTGRVGRTLACSEMEEPIKRKNKMIEGSRGGGRAPLGKPDTHNAPLS